jgi:hypothetical protein
VRAVVHVRTPMRVSPSGVVVARLLDGDRPWVPLAGVRAQPLTDVEVRRWRPFRLAPYGRGGGRDPRPWERYAVSRGT